MMSKGKIWAVLICVAVTGFLVGPVGAQREATGAEQGEKPEIRPDGTYIVRDGDTLWAIAGRYLDNPRLWPKIWKENPFVSNPNLIFPGDPLVIPGVTPPPQPVVEAPPVPPIAEERVAPPVSPPVEAPPPSEVAELEKPEEVIKVPEARPILAIPRPALECSGFVADPREVHEIGVIVRSTEEHDLRLWYGTQVFLDLGGRKVQRGDRFRVIRPTKAVSHPATGRSVGVKVRTLGTVEIVSTAGASPRAKVVYNCEDMAPGDGLVELKTRVAPPLGMSEPTDLRVRGYIVGSKSEADSLGRGDIVYVDVGQAKGIVPGDEFAVYQMSGITTSPATGRAVPLAPLKQGEMVVLRTFTKSAVGLLTRSSLVLRVGERIVLRRKMP
ncbi:MAG: LysM peptidoglycan-binding domain-containing protein [Candidatus Methylomirabilales bacterium]